MRELARIPRTLPGTLLRELTQLVKAGVLSREKIGNLVHYEANRESPKASFEEAFIIRLGNA